jgi:hypothetical protein
MESASRKEVIAIATQIVMDQSDMAMAERLHSKMADAIRSEKVDKSTILWVLANLHAGLSVGSNEKTVVLFRDVLSLLSELTTESIRERGVP